MKDFDDFLSWYSQNQDLLNRSSESVKELSEKQMEDVVRLSLDILRAYHAWTMQLSQD